MRRVRLFSGLCVTASVCACASLLHQGRTSGPTIAALLQRPSTVALWQRRRMSLDKTAQTSRTSPLVAQGRIYVTLLNAPTMTRPVSNGTSSRVPPKARPETKPPAPRARGIPQRTPPPFKVHTTSVFAQHPEKSMGLISEPGKGTVWIRPGDMVGDLKISPRPRSLPGHRLKPLPLPTEDKLL
ncbi:MAG: hypothetical protein GY809_19635 [Planctomycetes bacterium]|nr:hypothetical protein [Planctomycetota bacterium]